MSEVKPTKRWIFSVGLIIIVLAIAIVLILVLRKPANRGSIEFQVIGDYSGGMFVSWWDRGNGDVHLQHVNNQGDILWGSGGITVAKAANYDYRMSYDGQGGVLITWGGIAAADPDPAAWLPRTIYTQRVSTNGTLLWGNGVTTGITGVAIASPQVIPDGEGGFIFNWDDFSTIKNLAHNDALRIQKLNPDGQPLWGEKGILVVASSRNSSGTNSAGTSPGYQGSHVMFGDGHGGVLVLWTENGKYPVHNVLAQRIDAQGNFVWENPKQVNETFNDYYLTSSMGLGGGQIILSFRDLTYSSSNSTLLCINYDANELWRQTISNKYDPILWVADGRGGVFFTERTSSWQGPNHPFQARTYLQKLDRESTALWDNRLLILETNERSTSSGSLVVDGTGEATLAWSVRPANDTYGKIFAQRFDLNGHTTWALNGVPVLAEGNLSYRGVPKIIDSDSGSVIIVACVGHTAYLGDMIYAQKLDSSGNSVWGEGIRIDR